MKTRQGRAIRAVETNLAPTTTAESNLVGHLTVAMSGVAKFEAASLTIAKTPIETTPIETSEQFHLAPASVPLPRQNVYPSR